jgi:hypothetical protein
MLDTQEQMTAAQAVITQLNVVHDDHRVFETSVKDAQLYGLSPKLLGELMEIGLSHKVLSDGPYLDSDDLYNVSGPAICAQDGDAVLGQGLS